MCRAFFVSLLGSIMLGGVMASPGRADDETDCSALAEQASPQTAQQWFERGLTAGRCYRFEALAVRFGPGGFKTLEVNHDVDAEGEREVIRFLDGPAVELERQGHFLQAWALKQRADDAVQSTDSRAVDDLSRYYRFAIDGIDRVADREAIVLDVLAQDGMRYSHQFWLDKATGLPLKQLLINESGHILEAFQVARLNALERFGGVVTGGDDEPAVVARDGWQPSWLPQGYRALPVSSDVEINGLQMSRHLYSDGLSSLSIFSGALEGDKALREGLHRLGIFQAAVRHIEHDGQRYQVVVVGEMPTEVLSKIISNVQWQGDSPAS